MKDNNELFVVGKNRELGLAWQISAKQLPSAVLYGPEGDLVCFYAVVVVVVCSSAGGSRVLEKLMPAGGRNLYKSDYSRNRALIVRSVRRDL